MAKANLLLPDGTTVAIEGTADEVAIVLTKFSQPNEAAPKPRNKARRARSGTTGGAKNKTRKEGLTSLITGLADGGHFKSKRTIGDIQKKLEELGHIYAVTSISPCLTRLTKNHTLRRLKENKVWVYVN